jgi:linoleoyl-CoA desaturase
MSSVRVNKVRFAQPRGEFHRELRDRVDAYFKETGKSRRGNLFMAVKMTVWIALTVAIYVAVIHGGLGAWPSLALISFGGFCVAAVGFNVGHDAIHGATSTRPGLNWLFSWSFDLLGICSFNWRVQHNFQHHTYTNIPGSDGDIEPGPFLRLYPRDDTSTYHRHQHLYAWFLYPWAALNWIYLLDWVALFSADPRTDKRRSSAEVFRTLLGKASHLTLFVIIPLAFSPFSWWQIGIGYLAAGLTCGATLAVVFQLAHIVTTTSFPRANASNAMPDDWAEHQLHTTANFAPDSKLAHFICGGLEHQIEHHLFPTICHVHYPALSKIVKQCASDFGLPYHEFQTFSSALRSHYEQLRQCGQLTASDALS